MRFFPFVIVSLLVPMSGRAGAWVKAAGDGYAKLGSASFVSDVAYDDDGVRVDTEPFLLKAQTVYAYAEVGLAPRLMLVGYLPWVASVNQRDGDGDGDGGGGGGGGAGGNLAFHTLGFGDAQLGLQLGILQDGPFVAAVRGDVKLPLYQGAPSVQGRRAAGESAVPGSPLGGRSGPGFPKSAGNFPALGDGQVDVTLLALVGGAFPFDGFFTWETGYRLRTDDVSDAVVGGGTTGIWVLDRRMLPMWNLSFIYSLDAKKRDDGVPLETLGKGYVSTGPAVMVMLPEISALVGLTGGLALEMGAELVFRGRNAAGGFNLQSGISYAF